MTSDIHQSFFKNESVVVLFLDIKGAFDNVIPDLLINDLIDLKLPKNCIHFIKNLIFERKLISLNCGDNNKTYIVNKGLPQGSGLSPNLYSIHASVIEKLTKGRVKMLQFADDVVILYISGENIAESINFLETDVNVISKFLKNKGLELTPDKCNLVIFNKKGINVDKYRVRVNNIAIRPSNYTKFLGMYLDRKLNWQVHINNLINKCDLPLRILSCMRGNWWGADPKILLMLYKSLVRSKLEYCAFLISPSTDSYFEKLQKIQNKALRLALGYRNSTPINVMHAESKVPLLVYRFKYLGYKYVLKCLSFLNNRFIENLKSFSNLADNFIYNNNFKKSLLVKCYEDCWFHNGLIIQSETVFKFTTPYINSFLDIKVDLISGRGISTSSSPIHEFCHVFGDEDRIHIYTDGSKMSSNNNSKVGFAVWSSNNLYNVSYKIPDLASIYTAECLALINAFNLINSNNDLKFKIFSESESAIKSLLKDSNNKKNVSPIIILLKKEIAMSKSLNKDVIITWVPAHIGITGNENADVSAKNSANNGILLNVDIPVSDLFNIYNTKCDKENIDKLKDMFNVKGKIYYKMFETTDKKPWFYNFNFSRKGISTVNRIRSDHTSLNSSLFRCKIVNNNMCNCGLEPDSIEHIFWQCNLYSRERQKMIKNLEKIHVFGPYSINSILSVMEKKL